MKRFSFSFLLFFLSMISYKSLSQSKLSLVAGAFYNGNGFRDNVNGFGAILGIDYMPNVNHFFSIELRTRYGYYQFDDGTKWTTNLEGEIIPPKNMGKARLEYNLFSPQIGLVPKLYYHFDDDISLFLENEFSVGLMTGRFKYDNELSFDKKYFTEPIFNYVIGAGIEFNKTSWSFVGSIGYSTLNFRSKIRKHQPFENNRAIPDQDAILMINLIFKIKL